MIDGEDKEKITRALLIFKSRLGNKDPNAIITDYCLAEINALETVFSTSSFYLCKFHVRQAWHRSLARTAFGIDQADQKTISCMLIEIQEQIDGNDFFLKIEQLKKHKFYSKYAAFFKYFQNEWLSCERRWALHYRHSHYANMTTTNLCEAFNKVVKSYLGQKNRARRMRLDVLLQTLLTKVFPAEEAKYRREHQEALKNRVQFTVRFYAMSKVYISK